MLFGCPNPGADSPKSKDANLSALAVSADTLSPAFDAWTTEYMVSVANAVTSITVTGIASAANATVSGDNGVARTLIVGANPITISVTAPDRTTANTYVVTVYRNGPTPSDYTSANIGTLKGVPAGTFQRGVSNTFPEWIPKAAAISTVSAFRMSEKEITREQFAAMLTTDPSEPYYSSGVTDPVNQANWYHAIAFCNKLSIAEGLTPAYAVIGVDFTTLTYEAIPTVSDADWDAVTADWTADGYRLPTEMEWMWAAMGATGGGTGYRKGFAGSTGGNSLGDYAWWDGNSDSDAHPSGATHPAGTKSPNELGLYDMSGNVWEWCWDWYAFSTGTRYDITGPVTDYRGAASGTGRVLRGGSWSNYHNSFIVGERYSYYPYFQFLLSPFGFRVVRP